MHPGVGAGDGIRLQLADKLLSYFLWLIPQAKQFATSRESHLRPNRRLFRCFLDETKARFDWIIGREESELSFFGRCVGLNLENAADPKESRLCQAVATRAAFCENPVIFI